MNNEITIREAQRLVDQWIRQYGVRYFSELTNMALTEALRKSIEKKTKRDATRHIANEKLRVKN